MTGIAPPRSAPSAVVHLRPLATPLPMGFLGLAAGTFVVAGLQLGWVPQAQGNAVALVLVAFVFPLQAVAALLGFLCRDAAAATGMAVLAGTWLSLGLITLAGPPGTTSEAAGLLLVLSALVLWVPVAAAGPGKPVASGVIALSSLRFAVTGVHELSASETWKDTAGIVGLLLAAAAVYAAFALAIEDQRRHPLLPTWRQGAGAAAMHGDWSDQTEELVHEAGVRRQL
ncbi:GPR1/FUN34/YaaH family transporter [Streptomyces sp. CC208A]|uniref:GPR1/FUN34/YaaH family transporter n=1 Tax=Streptomyces sp. CC208A TaxID=3044573 RepID=UPI0024A91B53|nr:GPR1/FUN34/YaaH family transporter [Streptomyces sp. CC208A]